MILTFAWVEDFSTFEKESPVHCLAASIRATGSLERIILLISNYECLPPKYIELLESLSVEIHDVGKACSDYLRKYETLIHFPLFERLCFVRWLVIHDFIRHFHVHDDTIIVDGDVLFFASPESLKSAFNKKHFVLQGGPAFTYLSEPENWLGQYRNYLNVFVSDMEGFSTALSIDMQSKVARAHHCMPWNGQISSDRDLINALIANELLLQDAIDTEAKEHGLALSENALLMPDQIVEGQVVHQPITFKVDNSSGSPVLQANDARITHLHFPSNSVRYFTSVLYYLENTIKTIVTPTPGVFSAAQQCFKSVPLQPQRIASVLSNQSENDTGYYTGPRLSRLDFYHRVQELEICIHRGLWLSNTAPGLIDRFFPLNPATFTIADLYAPETWWQSEISFAWEVA